MKLINTLKKYVQNIPGPNLKKKYVVIESDDWGTIRMPSRQVYDRFIRKGLTLGKNPFEKYDSLESNEDMQNLFEVLLKHKDEKGNHPIITANTIVANPDFEKIKEVNFEQYFYEPFTETLKRYPRHDKVFDLYMTGIKKNIFEPQFHGREHVNIRLWMKELTNESSKFRYAASYGTFAIETEKQVSKRNNLMAAFDYTYYSEIKELKKIIESGIDLFSLIFKVQPKSFISPCYIWHRDIENLLFKKGIRSIQGLSYQYTPTENSNYRKIWHYTGQKTLQTQIYLVRNVFFEPTSIPNYDWINQSLRNIDIAFKMNKPVIIGSHRINFIGSIYKENSDVNLKLLDKLLCEILKKWPDVQFVSSSKLTNIIMDS